MHSNNESNKTRPNHYGGDSNPHEPIKVIEHYGLDFCLGNVIKYTLRAGKKENESTIDDLEKAIFYLNRKLDSEKRKQTNKF
jgi:iron-sulfur cluster repair protein YtfE (RIC family)